MNEFSISLALLLLLLLPGESLQAAGAVSFEQRMNEARRQYFADLQGDHAAAERAHAGFAALARDFPGDPVVDAYSGSLELLDAARTWAVWNKRKLASEGLAKMDQAVSRSPGNLEARFIRAASTWHLPFFTSAANRPRTTLLSSRRERKPQRRRGCCHASWRLRPSTSMARS
jgi:hypothetical protein